MGGTTFELDASGTVITVTLGANLVPATAYPATIFAAGGIRDADEGLKPIDLAGSGDVTLEDNGPEVLLNGFASAAGEITAAVTFNEPLSPAAEVEANYDFTDASAGGVTLQSAVLGSDGRTVTFTFAGGLLAIGDTLEILAGVADSDGQASVPSTLTVVA